MVRSKIPTTNLYLLRLKDDEKFSRMYDEDVLDGSVPDQLKTSVATGFIVRATSPQQARKFASECCSDEGPQTWLNPQFSTCRRLTPESAGLGIIMRDFRAG